MTNTRWEVYGRTRASELLKGVNGLQPYLAWMQLPAVPCLARLSPWASLPGGFEGVEPFPSLILPSIRLGLRGFGTAGPLVGGALLPSLADPAKIRVSTYCEKRARSGIITGEMKHTHKHTVRIFADVGGFYYSSGSLDTRGRAFPTISACVRYLRDSNALRDVPFTHYVRGERVRSLWGKAAR